MTITRRRPLTLVLFDIDGTLLLTGETAEAHALLRRAVALGPRNASARYVLAWSLATNADARHRDPRAAAELARQAVALEPGQVVAAEPAVVVAAEPAVVAAPVVVAAAEVVAVEVVAELEPVLAPVLRFHRLAPALPFHCLEPRQIQR